MRIFAIYAIFCSIFAVCLCAAQMQSAEFTIPTITPKKQEIADVKRYYATIAEDQSRTISLSVRVDGFIQKLFVDRIYTKVRAGEPLFLMYASELIDAQSEFLATRNALSRQKLELLGVDSKEIDKIAKSHRILNEVSFYSPIDGVIFTKNINVGSGVKKGDEVFKIVNLSQVWAIANINQEDIGFLQKANTKAYALIEGYDKRIPAQLELVYPQVSDGFVKARFIIDNPNERIYPNMFAYIFIESPKFSRLTLPKNAVLYKDNKYFVFVKEDDDFMPLEIQARRIRGSNFYEIIDGLSEEQNVAKNALFILDSDAQNNGDYEW